MPDRETVVDSVSFGHIPTNISYGRYQDTLWRFFKEATPLAENTTQAYKGMLEPVSFSHTSGFYTSDFMLEINHPNPDVMLFYTIDGSLPGDSSDLYTSQIHITDRSNEPNDISLIPTNTWPQGHSRGWNPPNGLIHKGTPLRVRASHPDYISSYRAATYFILADSSDKYSFPVISIITYKDGLFDADTGIHVPGTNGNSNITLSNNYAQRGIEWERRSEMHFFTKEGNLDLEQTVGIRIHGGYTRNFPQKSLRVYARNLYGERNFEYPLFPDKQDETYRRFILRNSGNDWNMTMFRDGAAQSLVSHLNMDVQAFRPTIVFLNGEYWGIHNIRERYDRHYLERVYGVDPENIDLLSRNSELKEGDTLHYVMTRAFVEDNDLSDDSLKLRKP